MCTHIIVSIFYFIFLNPSIQYIYSYKILLLFLFFCLFQINKNIHISVYYLLINRLRQSQIDYHN